MCAEPQRELPTRTPPPPPRHPYSGSLFGVVCSGCFTSVDTGPACPGPLCLFCPALFSSSAATTPGCSVGHLFIVSCQSRSFLGREFGQFCSPGTLPGAEQVLKRCFCTSCCVHTWLTWGLQQGARWCPPHRCPLLENGSEESLEPSVKANTTWAAAHRMDECVFNTCF